MTEEQTQRNSSSDWGCLIIIILFVLFYRGCSYTSDKSNFEQWLDRAYPTQEE